MARLERPRGLSITFQPSERQYEVWNALQPNQCDKCGGSLTLQSDGYDQNGHEIYKPVCSKCGNSDIPEQILEGGSAGGGKMLMLESSVCTPYGFRKLKDIQFGDIITDPTTGGIQKVLQLHPIETHPFYKIRFSDGTQITCSEGHLWKVYLKTSLSRDREEKLWETKTIHDFFQYKKNDWYKDARIGIPLTKPVEFAVKGRKVNPNAYNIGVSLAKGSFRVKKSATEDTGWRHMLPKDCLMGSVQTRQELIRGLLDSCVEGSSEGCPVYRSIVKQLAYDVAFIVRSLGGLATVRKINPESRKGRALQESRAAGYEVEIRMHQDPDGLGKEIAGIEYIGMRESRCITVSNPSGLYVVNDFTVTHNSFLGCCWLVSSCIRFSGIRMVVARKVRKTLLETTWVTLNDVLNRWNLQRDVHYHVNNLAYTITFWNGSEIMAMDLTPSPQDPDFNSLGSLEITGGFIDEVSEVSEKAVEVLASRIRYKIAETFVVGKLLMSCNPSLTWVRSTFVMDDNGDPVTLPPGYRYIPFSLFDNPDEQFRAIYYNKLKKLRNKADRDRLLYGNWLFTTSNKMAAYWNFDGEIHLVQNLKESCYDPLKPLILSFDFNVNPYMSCLPIQIDYTEKIVYVFPEYVGYPKEKHNNTPTFTRWIASLLKRDGHIGGLLLTGDPAGLARSTQTEEGVNNFTIAVKNFAAGGLNPKMQLLSKQPAMVTRLEFINELFKGYNGWTVKIDARCHKLTEDFVYQKKNPDGSKEKKKVLNDSGERVERFGHFSDCFDYAMVYYLSELYSSYRSGSAEIVTTIEPDQIVYGEFDY